MGRAAVGVLLALLAGGAPANAEPPTVSISASATAGAAPLAVAFEAQGDAASYRWLLGNGETAEGPTASATYGPGLWTVEVTATGVDGATSQATMVVRSVAISLLPAAKSRYREPALVRGSIVPPRAREQVLLYARGRKVAAARAASDGRFQLRLARVLTPGPYVVRTPIASSAPLALRVSPAVQASFVGGRAVGAHLRLVARVRPATAGALTIRLYRDGKLLRRVRAGATVRLAVPTDRVAGYRAVVEVQPAPGWLRSDQVARAAVVAPEPALGSLEWLAGQPVLRDYAGLGPRFQPLLTFAALNRHVSHRRAGAARLLAAALLARGVASGDALYWEYDFSFQGSAVPWRSGFVQAVAAQALARAGVMLGDPSLRAAADASFRGLRRTLLIPLAGGSWIREYGFSDQVILNAQLQSILSLESYAAIARTANARRVVRDLVVAARRLLPRFEIGCWARYELGGAAATLRYQTYHVELLRRLAVTRPEPIWRTTYDRWRRCVS